jgi:hypothetical protein
VKYFFDNCISPKLPEMLHALGVDAVALSDGLPSDTKDIALFGHLCGRELVFISTDTSQLTRQQEARALKQAGVTALYLGPFFPKMKLWAQAVWLVTKWPGISAFACNIAMGSCAEIKQNGTARFYPL